MEQKEFKHVKYNPDKFKIKYNDIVFKDINEFVVDLGNIFTLMSKAFQDFKADSSLMTGEEMKQQLEVIASTLKCMKDDLEKRLDYITDTNQVSETVTGKVRSKLLQLNALSRSIDFSKDTANNLDILTEFYYKRVLEEKVAVTGKFFSKKKE
ncbi:MAG: hypothetical protein PHF84_09230 [bacterium]|nr:hypothetical protein [bacterium]